jgi:3-phenylpropionate/trans-cinnamate dioxygenase ferredoxin component
MGELKDVAKVGEIANGEAKLVEIDGKELALFNAGGEYFAIDNECTHVGGPLCEGDLDGHTVTCPWHGAEFDITSGEALAPPAEENVKCYKVVVDGDSIKVEV